MCLLLLVGPAMAGEVTPVGDPTPTPTIEPTRAVPTIHLRCEITMEPANPGVGDTVTVDIRRISNGLGYPGREAFGVWAGALFVEVSQAVGFGAASFDLRAVEEGAVTIRGLVMDEFVVGYSGYSPLYSFANTECRVDVVVGPASTATPTQPSPTPTATQPTATRTLTSTPTATIPSPTPTFTPTSCVSDTPRVIEAAGSVMSVRRRLVGFNRGLFCFRGGSISVSGAETVLVQIDCNEGTYAADIVLSEVDAVSSVTVCHHPGVCGSVGCRTVQIAHASARSFSVNTIDDGSDTTPGDDECATATGACSLRAAVQEANAHPDGGTTSIHLEPRTHALALDADDDISADAGDLDVTSEIRIAGAVAGSVIAGDVDGLPTARQSAFTVHGEGVLFLTDVTVRGAHGWQGGAVSNTGLVRLERVTLTRNIAGALDGTGGYGGGIWNSGAANLIDVTVAENAAMAVEGVGVTSGGGVWNNGQMRIARSTISNNSATGGGGVYNASALELTNVTISSNTACCLVPDSRGGGIMNDLGVVRLRNVTIANNSATGEGAGLYGYAEVADTIFAANPPDAGSGRENCFQDVPPISSGGNNIDTDGTCRLAASGDRQGDPRLRELGDYGGRTRTHALHPDSIAIDAGSGVGCVEQDQRGVPRPLDGDGIGAGICDIGAFEYRGSGDAGCLGDCDGSGSVTIEEVVRSVSIALSRGDMAGCFGVDGNADGAVVVNEIVGAVDRLLHGCVDE